MIRLTLLACFLVSSASAELMNEFMAPAVSTSTLSAIDILDSRVKILEHAGHAPVDVYILKKPAIRLKRALPSIAQTMLDTKLTPQIKYHLGRIDDGSYTPEDIAFVVAGYNTYGETKALAQFCKRAIRLNVDAGMRVWLADQCSTDGE